MLSRDADAIFWLNRYVERAENVARFVDATLYLTLDLPAPFVHDWQGLLETTGDEALFAERYGEATRANVMLFLTFDRSYPSSIVSCLSAARENARSIREVISSEMWEEINRSYLTVSEAASSPASIARILDAPYDFFAAVKSASHAFVGVTHLTMTHAEPWHFGRLGRVLERADKTSRILDVKARGRTAFEGTATTADLLEWGALLKSASALEMYRKAHGAIAPRKVVSFLVLAHDFPRSMRFSMRLADQSLRHITGTKEGSFDNQAEKLIGRLRAELDYVDVDELLQPGLHTRLADFQARIFDAGEAIFSTFFAMPAPEPSIPEPPASVMDLSMVALQSGR